MTKAEFLAELEDLLQREETCNESDVLEDYAEWDSLSQMSIMAFYKKHFAIQVTLNDLAKLKTVQDLILLSQGNIA